MAATMKALVKAKPEPGLWLEEVPIPEVGINDVLIKIYKTAICGTDIHIYNWSTARGLSVACIIPKKEYLTVNLIGERNVGRNDLQSFLHSLMLQKKLPENWRWADNVCSCSPLVATTPAARPWGSSSHSRPFR